MKQDIYSTRGQLEFFSEARRFCSYICTVSLNVGYTLAYSQSFKYRQRKGNNVEKCEKKQHKGNRTHPYRERSCDRRRGNLRLTDSQVGGQKLSKVNNLMNFKFPKKAEREDICSYLRILYSELRMLFYLSNRTSQNFTQNFYRGKSVEFKF